MRITHGSQPFAMAFALPVPARARPPRSPAAPRPDRQHGRPHSGTAGAQAAAKISVETHEGYMKTSRPSTRRSG